MKFCQLLMIITQLMLILKKIKKIHIQSIGTARSYVFLFAEQEYQLPYLQKCILYVMEPTSEFANRAYKHEREMSLQTLPYGTRVADQVR